MGDKHETRTCEFVGPHAHAFIQAIHVAWKEVVPHVCPPRLNHLLYFPKDVHEHWWSNIGEGKQQQDDIEVISGHPHAQTKGGPIKCMDWVCGPELVPLWADESPHKHPQTNPTYKFHIQNGFLPRKVFVSLGKDCCSDE